MSTSMILFLVGLGCGAGFAALAVHGQVRGGTRLREVGWGVPAGILVTGAIFGGLAYWLDSSIARTTLFEVDADGSTGVAVRAPAPVREYDVLVEHPGVEHELFVSPTTGRTGGDPDFAVELQVRLIDPAGAVIVDRPLLLQPECTRSAGCGWEDWTFPFTPASAAPHRLAVTVLTVDVPLFARHAGAVAARDAAALDAVSGEFAARGCPRWAAEAAATAAALHRKAGRRGSALAATARAEGLLVRCPAVRTPALEQLGAAPVLTSRERDVAGLAARGLSDRDIAARLQLSVRTVHSHLHRTYHELGIGDRAELAALLGPGQAGRTSSATG